MGPIAWRLTGSSVVVLLAGCMGVYPGDTAGEQRRAEWWTDARITVMDDSVLTVRRVGVTPGTHDVVVGAFDFNTDNAVVGDEFSMSFAIDLGPPDSLETDVIHQIGGPGGLEAALGSRIGLGPVLRPDSMRGELLIFSRGMMQMFGRIRARLYYSSWNDSSNVVVETFRQRVDFLRPPQRTP